MSLFLLFFPNSFSLMSPVTLPHAARARMQSALVGGPRFLEKNTTVWGCQFFDSRYGLPCYPVLVIVVMPLPRRHALVTMWAAAAH